MVKNTLFCIEENVNALIGKTTNSNLKTKTSVLRLCGNRVGTGELGLPAKPAKYRVKIMVYPLSTLNAKRDETAKYFSVVFGHGFYVQYLTLLHLTPPRFHCFGGCWDESQDCVATLALAVRRSSITLLSLELIKCLCLSVYRKPLGQYDNLSLSAYLQN
jgi:hypothetical protein